MICESEHNNNHQLIYLKDLLINKNSINLDEFNEKISKLEDEIRNYITKFNQILSNMQIYNKIITNIINNTDLNKRNYQSLINLKNIIQYKNNAIEEINKITTAKNYYYKLNAISDILCKMENNSNNINNNSFESNITITVQNKQF